MPCFSTSFRFSAALPVVTTMPKLRMRESACEYGSDHHEAGCNAAFHFLSPCGLGLEDFTQQVAAEQLLLYTELARDFAPGKPLRIEFSVLTKTKEVSVDRHGLAVDPARVDRTKRVIARIWNAIAGQHFYPAPSITGCGGCPFRQPCRIWRGWLVVFHQLSERRNHL